MTRRLWIGGALAVPVVALDMGGHLALPARPVCLDRAAVRHAGRAVGRLAVLRARRAVGRARALNMFTLIALGTGTAWLYSVAGDRRIRPAGLFRIGRRHHRADPARPGPRIARARGDLRRDPRPARPRAAHGAPDRQGRQRRGSRDRRDRVGDRLRVRPGEKVPVDGIVDRRQRRGRRIDRHRRADAGREGARRQA